MESRSLFVVTILFLAMCSGALARSEQIILLPLNISVDLDDVANFGDHPDPDNVATQLTAVLRDHVSDELYDHWYLSTGAANVEMVLGITQRQPRGRLRLALSFEGDTEDAVNYKGIRPETVPVDGDMFLYDLVDALDEFLIEKQEEIEAVSRQVHLTTNDVLRTELHLDRPLQDEDRIRFRSEKLDIKWDHALRSMTYKSDGSDRFHIHVVLRPGEERRGTLKPRIYQTRIATEDLPLASFCVHRPLIPDPRDATVPTVELQCPLAGPCALRGANPANWADDLCEPVRPEQDTNAFPGFTGKAFAATGVPLRWNVPALDVLFDRVEETPERFVGFTEFVIRSRDLAGLDADQYSVAVRANGVSVLLNGQDPENHLRKLNAERGLLFRFGLENLQFAGREDGCEALDVEFRFYRDGVPVGVPLRLSRRYAALRDAPVHVFETGYGRFAWAGDYISPSGRNENGIFLASALFNTSSREEERRAIGRLDEIRKTIDGFGWTIPARELGLGLGMESVQNEEAQLRIVGKLRPPRTVRPNGDAAYGVLVGVEEPSGQLQFTFDWSQKTALERFLKQRRTENSTARSVVPDDLFIYAYSQERQSGPDWVCSQ